MNKHKLVPAGPTDDELIAWAGEEQFFLFCDRDEFLQIARAVMQRYAAPRPAEQQPAPDVAGLQAELERERNRRFDGNEQASREHREDMKALVDALEELVDLMEDTRRGEYTPDSFTTQPARIALAAYRKGGE